MRLYQGLNQEDVVEKYINKVEKLRTAVADELQKFGADKLGIHVSDEVRNIDCKSGLHRIKDIKPLFEITFKYTNIVDAIDGKLLVTLENEQVCVRNENAYVVSEVHTDNDNVAEVVADLVVKYVSEVRSDIEQATLLTGGQVAQEVFKYVVRKLNRTMDNAPLLGVLDGVIYEVDGDNRIQFGVDDSYDSKRLVIVNKKIVRVGIDNFRDLRFHAYREAFKLFNQDEDKDSEEYRGDFENVVDERFYHEPTDENGESLLDADIEDSHNNERNDK